MQFVLADRTPTSSYVVPTQQLVLATYIYLMLICIESIIVYHISHWRERQETARVRWGMGEGPAAGRGPRRSR